MVDFTRSSLSIIPDVEGDDLETLLNGAIDWNLEFHNHQLVLRKTFLFAEIGDEERFLLAVSDLADRYNHHPVVVIDWCKLDLYWSDNHSRTIDKKNFELALKTNLIFNSKNRV